MSKFWLVVNLVLAIPLIAVMLLQAVATLSLYALLYAGLGATMTFTWWQLHRRGPEAAAASDVLFFMSLFFVFRVATPAFDWLATL
jgi:hypothetical protein